MRLRLALGLALWAVLLSAGAETIGLRFVVDVGLGATAQQRQAAAARLGDHVAELNGYFRASQVALVAEVVDVEFAAIESTDVMDILADMEAERRGFAGFFARAAEYGADYSFAVLGRMFLRGKRACGRAYAVNKTVAEISSTRRAFAAVDIACGAHTLAHELGHLMGLNHGHLVDSCDPGRHHTAAIAPYANGYGEGPCDGRPGPAKFGTLMVGGWMKAVNGDGRASLPLFSNPRLRDSRCGIRGICGDPLIGDEARALNENARYYAAHETPDAHTLPFASAALAECLRSRYRGRKAAELDELVCPGAGIESVAGVERLTALRRVDLSDNALTDADALAALAIEDLDLRGNGGLSCISAGRLARALGQRVRLPASCNPAR